jgi:Na+-transporting methylmalonyl-CoA/oxaloacetate decarboxylase gamma subunit
MYLLKGFSLIFLIIGIVLLVVYFITMKTVSNVEQKVVYRYIPRTLEEEMETPIYISEIFKTMFSQPSTWIDSTDDDAIRRKENMNKYFISQM